MTVSSTTRTAGPFTGTGVLVNYPFTFKVFQASDLFVAQTAPDTTQTTWVLSADYTVTLNSDQNASPGGYVTPLVALPVGYTVTLTSAVPVTQPLSLPNNGPFLPSSIEDELDRLTILMQQQGFSVVGQSLRVPEVGGIPTLPATASRANTVLAFDASGNPIGIVGIDASSATALDLSLRDATLAGKGSGQVGFLYSLAYGAGTIGAELKAKGTVVSSIAGLRAMPKTAQPNAFVTGYYAAGDGGGGAYYYDAADTTTADNGGTVIVASDGGRWKLANTHAVSICQFGVCTSQADNTVRLNTALAWASTVVGNTTSGSGSKVMGSLYAPDGEYAHSGTIFQDEGVLLRGGGSGSTFFKYTGIGGTAWQLGSTSTINTTVYRANISLRDLTLYASVANAASIGVSMVNAIRKCKLPDVQIYGFGFNLSFSNSASWAIHIDGGFFHDALVNNIKAQACNTLRFSNMRLDTAAQDNVVLDGSTSTNQPLDVVFDFCIIQGAQFSGVKAIDCYQITFRDCDMEGNNLAPGGAYSDIKVLKGAQNRTCQIVRIEGGFYSAGTSPNTTHRIADIADTQTVIVSGILSSGGSNNYDAGILLASTVVHADIHPCVFNGCVTAVSATSSTQVRWRNELGNIVLGDYRAGAATLDVQRLRTPTGNLVNFYNTSSAAGSVALQTQVGTTAGAGFLYYGLNAAGANVFRVLDTGDCRNTNNVFAAISDEKLKQDIAPAPSAWSDFMAYEFVKYRFKSDPGGPLQVGVIAQQIEKISPGLVSESPDFQEVEVTEEVLDKDGSPVLGEDLEPLRRHVGFERVPTGTSTKEVKYSVLYLKACLVVQELQRRVEALEQKIKS